MSGKPVTSKPVYGYPHGRDENYIVDEETAPVSSRYTSFALPGTDRPRLYMLTGSKSTPGTLECRTGSTRRYHPGYRCKWATNTVVHILENREYTGCLVNFKTEKPSYKGQAQCREPVEKQAILRTTGLS